MTHIAIIGAGIAGLSAMQKLQTKSCQISLFDKARGPGGRLSSRKTPYGTIDLGAQYFTARSVIFKKLVADLCEQGIIEPWNITPWKITQTTIQSSPDATERFIGTPRMSAISRFLSNGHCQIHTSTRIIKTHYRTTEKQWFLEADNQEKLYGPYDAILITTPPAQAIDLVKSTQVENICKTQSMQACWSIWMAFDEALPLPFNAAFCNHPMFDWICHMNSKPGRILNKEMWLVTTTPEWSHHHLDSSHEQVTNTAFQHLEQLLSRMNIHSSSQLIDAGAHRWLYARPSTDNQPLQPENLWDFDKRIGIAGDWCYEGRVEGGYLSGQTIADTMIKQLQL